MDAQFIFQLGREQVAITTTIQQLNERLQVIQREHQETRTLLEALGKAQGWEWSQDVKQWVSKSKLDALKSSPLDSPSA